MSGNSLFTFFSKLTNAQLKAADIIHINITMLPDLPNETGMQRFDIQNPNILPHKAWNTVDITTWDKGVDDERFGRSSIF